MSSGSSAVPLQAHRRIAGNALVNNRPDDDRKPAGVDTSESSSDDDDFDDDFDDEMRVLMEGDDSDDGGHADDTESEAMIITSDGEGADDSDVACVSAIHDDMGTDAAPTLPALQCTVQSAVALYFAVTYRHRMILAKEIVEGLIHWSDHSDSIETAAEYFKDVAGYKSEVAIALVPQGFRCHDGAPGAPPTNVLSGAEKVSRRNISRLQCDGKDNVAMWLDTTIFVTFQSVVNSHVFRDDVHMFSPVHTDIALRIPATGKKRSGTVSCKSIEKQTRLMIADGKDVEGVMLTNRRFWFLPWNKTCCHWTCWMVDTKEKRLIFFNPTAIAAVDCLKPMRRHRQAARRRSDSWIF